MCKDAIETRDHIFTNCRKAIELRQAVHHWAKLLPTQCSRVSEIVDETMNGDLDKDTRLLKQVTGQAYIWSIWKSINDIIFNNKVFNPLRTANDIQSLVFLWFSSRGSKNNLNWLHWCCNPLDVFS